MPAGTPYPEEQSSPREENLVAAGPPEARVLDLVWIALAAVLVSAPLALATFVIDGLNDKPWNRVTSATYVRIVVIGLGVGFLVWRAARRGRPEEVGARCFNSGLLASCALLMTFCIWGEWVLKDTFRTSFERPPQGTQQGDDSGEAGGSK